MTLLYTWLSHKHQMQKHSKETCAPLKAGRLRGICNLIRQNARSSTPQEVGNPFKPPIYRLHNTILEATTSAKYLGVDISDDLTWETHINRITKTANQTLGFLKRNIKIHSEELKATAYKALVRPKLEYCCTVWSPYQQTLIQQIEAVQRRAARWVKRNYRQTASVSDMLQELGWRTLEQRRIDNRLSLCYKIVNNLVAIPSEEYFTHTHRNSRSTHQMALRPISTSTDYYKFSYFPRTITHWNALPPAIPSLPTIEQFNSAVCKVEHTSP